MEDMRGCSVVVEIPQDTINEFEIDGQKLYLDAIYRKYHHAMMKATVVEVHCPRGQKSEIERGDVVYCHHFIIAPDSEVPDAQGRNLRLVEYEQIYCKLMGKELRMLNGYTLLEPIEAKREERKIEGFDLNATTSGQGSTKVGKGDSMDYLKRQGIMRHKPAMYNEVQVGERVIMLPDADFDIKIEGKEFFRVRVDELVCVVPDGVKVEAV
jgi:hypothetical protein